jgi:hypothetical protein
MPSLTRRRNPDRADCWRIRPLWVIRDRVEPATSLGVVRYAPIATKFRIAAK